MPISSKLSLTWINLLLLANTTVRLKQTLIIGVENPIIAWIGWLKQRVTSTLICNWRHNLIMKCMRLPTITWDTSLSTGKTILKRAIISRNTFSWRKVRTLQLWQMRTTVSVTAIWIYATLKRPNAIIHKQNKWILLPEIILSINSLSFPVCRKTTVARLHF